MTGQEISPEGGGGRGREKNIERRKKDLSDASPLASYAPRSGCIIAPRRRGPTIGPEAERGRETIEL